MDASGEDGKDDGDSMKVKRLSARRLVRVVAVALACLTIAVSLVAYHIVKSPINMPGNLPDSDKNRIVRLARWHTLSSALHIVHGEFRQGIRALRVLPKQQINELRENHDGTYRVYVVVFDNNEPEALGSMPGPGFN